MNTPVAERLFGYYRFDVDIIDAAVQAVDEIQDSSYQDFLAKNKVPEPAYHDPEHGNPIQYLDLKPDGYSDEEYANVLHLPMGSGLTANKIVRAVALHNTDPTSRLIVIGGPGLPFRDTGGKLDRNDRIQVAKGKYRALAEPVLDLLTSNGIVSSSQIGVSKGAEVAAAVSSFAGTYEHEVGSGIFVEPVSVAKRGLWGVMAAYASTNKGYQETLKETDFPLLAESRKLSENGLTYMLALARLTNIAMAKALGRDNFEELTENALAENEEMKAVIGWGNKSEMALHHNMQFMNFRLDDRFKGRVIPMNYNGRHGTLDDLPFHSAFITQALRNAI